jgi:hypothetical protein
VPAGQEAFRSMPLDRTKRRLQALPRGDRRLVLRLTERMDKRAGMARDPEHHRQGVSMAA